MRVRSVAGWPGPLVLVLVTHAVGCTSEGASGGMGVELASPDQTRRSGAAPDVGTSTARPDDAADLQGKPICGPTPTKRAEDPKPPSSTALVPGTMASGQPDADVASPEVTGTSSSTDDAGSSQRGEASQPLPPCPDASLTTSCDPTCPPVACLDDCYVSVNTAFRPLVRLGTYDNACDAGCGEHRRRYTLLFVDEIRRVSVPSPWKVVTLDIGTEESEHCDLSAEEASACLEWDQVLPVGVIVFTDDATAQSVDVAVESDPSVGCM